MTRLSYPLPSDRAAAKAALDAACLALWGGAHWTRPTRRKGQQMPVSWRFQGAQARAAK